MHITLEADYAVRIVNCLTRCKTRMDAKSLASATGVTLRFSLKILRKLVAQGIACIGNLAGGSDRNGRRADHHQPVRRGKGFPLHAGGNR